MSDRFMSNRAAGMIATALRWTLSGLFVWAGAVKLADPKAFARSIDAFGLVPEAWLPAAAIGLPLMEIAAGLAVWRRWRGGLPAMTVLLLLFTAALGLAVIQNLDIDCGCFSVAEQQAHTSAKTAFVRDLLLLAGVAWLGVHTRGAKRHPDMNHQESPSTTHESEVRIP